MKINLLKRFDNLSLLKLMTWFFGLSFITYSASNFVFNIFDIYFLLCLLLCCPLLFTGGEDKSHGDSSLNTKNVLFFTLVYFAVRLMKFNEMNIWIDEYSQYRRSLSRDLYQSAFAESQPPLDYLFTFLSVQLFGAKAFALKVGPLLWGYLSLFALFFMGQTLKVSKKINLLMTTLYLGHPLIIGYHLEGRPYSLALFLGFLCFNAHLSFKKNKTSPLHLLSANILFLLSIGLQPVVFIISTFLSFVLILPHKKRTYTLVNFFSLLLVIPLYLWLISKNSNGFHGDNDTLIFSFNFTTRFFEEGLLFLKGSLLYTGIFVISLLYSKHKFKKNLPSFIPLFLFILLNFIIFSTLIKWNFHLRYILLATPFLFFALFNLLKDIPIAENIFHTIMSFLVATNLARIPIPLHENYYFFGHKDWKSLHHYLNQNVSENDEILRINFGHPFDFRVGTLIGRDLYAKPSLLDRLEHRSLLEGKLKKTLSYNPKIDYCRPQSGHLFIVYENTRNSSKVRVHESDSAYHQIVYKGAGLTVAKVPLTTNKAITLKSYFEWLVQEFGSGINNYASVESLYLYDQLFSPQPNEDYSYFFERLFSTPPLRKRGQTIKSLLKATPKTPCKLSKS